MRVFLVGEASIHREDLLNGLAADLRDRIEIVDLPREAARDPAHDALITPEDIVVSLRLNRNGAPLPRMRMLHVPGAGLDGIDLKALHPDTILCNVFEHEIPIAEFTLGSLLDWEIDFAGMQRCFTPESWPDIYRARVPHGEIYGKTLVILGYGRIGQAVATRAAAFGMRVLAVDPVLAGKSDPLNVATDIVSPARLAEVAAKADYLVITCPLTDESRGSVDRPVLDALGTDGVLLNVSRAEVVDEDDLYAALASRRIRGATLDVWYRYPEGSDDLVVPANHDFHALPNVRATPHSSAWTRELSHRRYAVIAANIAALVRGHPLRNRINIAA
ncbi:NAD(P)-dependent oxidoreductase [Pseudochelatococcus sp. B33]